MMLSPLPSTRRTDAVVDVPLPVTGTAKDGLLLAFDVIVTLADAAPALDGVKVTSIVHVADGATVDGHLLTAPNAAEELATLLILRFAVPVFLTVSVLAALVVPTGWSPNARLVGETLIAGFVGLAPSAGPASTNAASSAADRRRLLPYVAMACSLFFLGSGVG